MKLEELVRQVETRLFGLLSHDTDDTPGDEEGKLRREIRQSSEEIQRLTTELEQRQKGLEERAVRVALLPSQIESSVRRGKAAQAMRQSLELEQLRRMVEADREIVQRLEQALWCQKFRLRQLRRQLVQMPRDGSKR